MLHAGRSWLPAVFAGQFTVHTTVLRRAQMTQIGAHQGRHRLTCQLRQNGGYRVSHDRGAVTVGNEAPVWTSPTKPKSRMTTRSRHRLITGLLVNLTLHYGKLFSAGWTSIRHWAWLSSTGQPSSDRSASGEAGNRFRDEPPERGPAGRRRWPRARS